MLRAPLLVGQPEQLPLLHQRASRWYELRDMLRDAVKHALAHGTSTGLRALWSSPCSRSDATGATRRWSVVPGTARRGHPGQSGAQRLQRAHALASGDLAGVEPRLADAERALASVPDGSALPWSRAAELNALLGNHRRTPPWPRRGDVQPPGPPTRCWPGITPLNAGDRGTGPRSRTLTPTRRPRHVRLRRAL